MRVRYQIIACISLEDFLAPFVLLFVLTVLPKLEGHSDRTYDRCSYFQ